MYMYTADSSSSLLTPPHVCHVIASLTHSLTQEEEDSSTAPSRVSRAKSKRSKRKPLRQGAAAKKDSAGEWADL
jgi:hypothetical protein